MGEAELMKYIKGTTFTGDAIAILSSKYVGDKRYITTLEKDFDVDWVFELRLPDRNKHYIIKEKLRRYNGFRFLVEEISL